MLNQHFLSNFLKYLIYHFSLRFNLKLRFWLHALSVSSEKNMSISVFPSVRLSTIHQFVSPLVCQSINPSVYLSVCLFVCLSICRSVCSFIYLSNFIFLSFFVSLFLSFCLSVCLCITVSLFTHLYSIFRQYRNKYVCVSVH
jgi:hypothetical protein